MSHTKPTLCRLWLSHTKDALHDQRCRQEQLHGYAPPGSRLHSSPLCTNTKQAVWAHAIHHHLTHLGDRRPGQGTRVHVRKATRHHSTSKMENVGLQKLTVKKRRHITYASTNTCMNPRTDTSGVYGPHKPTAWTRIHHVNPCLHVVESSGRSMAMAVRLPLTSTTHVEGFCDQCQRHRGTNTLKEVIGRNFPGSHPGAVLTLCLTVACLHFCCKEVFLA